MSEPLDASVTVEEIFVVVGARRVPLAPELAGYLILEVAESCDDAVGEIDPSRIHVGEEGTVAVVKPRGGSGDTQHHLRKLLGKLLEASGTQTAALSGVAKKSASGTTVEALVEELEAALIPVNRSAGRRALARLARETKRVTLRVGRNAAPPSRDPSRDSPPSLAKPDVRSERPPPASGSFDLEEVPTTARREIPAEIIEGASDESPPSAAPTARKLEQPPSLSELPTVGIAKEELEAVRANTKRDSFDSLLDKFEVSGPTEDRAVARELKAIAGLNPTPPPQTTDDGIESLLEASIPRRSAPPKPEIRPDTKPETRPAKRRSEPPPKREAPKPRDRAPSFADDRQLPTAPSLKRSVSLTSEMKPKKSTRDRNLVVALLLLLIVLAVVLWTMKPGFLTGRTPEKIDAERQAAEAESARLATQHAVGQCRATLLVEGAPKDSEILLRVGQGPADVDHMPAGTRLEFVATADGYAPRRGVVPQTTWDSSNGRPRYELAVQLDKSKLKAGAIDPWPPVEPGSEVGGKGSPGIVHVITTPKGAELWLLAGLGPDASIDDFVQCDESADVLVAIGTKRSRYHVDAKSFVPDPGGKPNLRVAKLNASGK
ncbi:hypothetical protein BH09MYX1_BH09MYX1_20390 [soil metagenome]